MALSGPRYMIQNPSKSGAQETRPNFQIRSLSSFQSIPSTLSRRSVASKFIERSGLLPHLQSGARNYSEFSNTTSPRNAIFKLEIFRMRFFSFEPEILGDLLSRQERGWGHKSESVCIRVGDWGKFMERPSLRFDKFEV